jgi:hypothetical protein
MNQYEMVVIIVVAVMIAGILKARYKSHGARPADDAETLRMREEVKAMRERIHVLERIVTEKEDALSREIEQLRDR